MSFTAIILAGGSGTRFWPASRRDRPKQLLSLLGDRSLLRATYDRLARRVDPAALWISTTERLGDRIARELPELPPERILREPSGRNTAPAIAWAVASLPPERRRGVVVVLPSDHHLGDEGAFLEALDVAVATAGDRNAVVTLGVRPGWPETGYGYLELARQAPEEPAPVAVHRFTEKPDAATAKTFVEGRRHLWNAGIFVFPGDRMLELLVEHQPELGAGVQRIVDEGLTGEELAVTYDALPALSIDYALMEHLDDLVAVPLDCGWNDLGSWDALGHVLPADAERNRRRGDAVLVDARENVVVSDHGTVALIGVENLVVVHTEDAVLVVPRGRGQEVRAVVEELRRRRRDDLL